MRTHARWLIVLFMLWLPIGQAAAVCCPLEAMQVAHSATEHEQHCAHDSDVTDIQSVDIGCLSACAVTGHGPVVAVTTLAPARLQDDLTTVWPAASPLSAHDFPLLRPPIVFS